MQHETVIVLDFGGQYNQLIARRVRENNVYCEIYSYKMDLSVIKAVLACAIGLNLRKRIPGLKA